MAVVDATHHAGIRKFCGAENILQLLRADLVAFLRRADSDVTHGETVGSGTGDLYRTDFLSGVKNGKHRAIRRHLSDRKIDDREISRLVNRSDSPNWRVGRRDHDVSLCVGGTHRERGLVLVLSPETSSKEKGGECERCDGDRKS